MSPTNSPLVELALDAHCDLGESPIWDTRKQMLYFVDINRKSIHAFSPSEGTHEALELSEPIGCIALTSDPACLLAATQRDILLVRFWGEDKGPIKTLATVPEEHGVKDMRFNDGKVTPQGAFLVGRMHSSWRKGERGRLYALDPGANDLREVLAPSEVWLPNGLVWTEDGKVCYFVDSGEESITAYETDALGCPLRGTNGALAGREVARLPTSHAHVPDGMAIDANGNLWVAMGESSKIVCYSAATGEALQEVTLPVKRPTSCIFGGPGLEEMYVVTRVESGDAASEHHGGIFRVKIPGVRGLAPEPYYHL